MPFSCVLIFWLCHQIWILILLMSPYHQTCWNKQFLYSSSFFLASVGVISALECFLFLYFVNIMWQNIGILCTAMKPWTVSCSYILCFIVLFRLSTTLCLLHFSLFLIFAHRILNIMLHCNGVCCTGLFIINLEYFTSVFIIFKFLSSGL